MRRLLVLIAAFGLLVTPLPAGAEDPPLPEADLLGQSPVVKPCTAEAGNTYEQSRYAGEGWTDTGRYPGDCRRLRFAFGPIHVKPGQNDVLLEPVTIAKPAFDGYVVRFKPNLVDATGHIPGVDQIHLHHAVWLNLAQSYGNGTNPFFATGEEKTIMELPSGYGFPVRATDTWQILYMIHNQYPQPTELWITYEIDIVPSARAAALGLKQVYPLWLDVKPSFYPVFNTQRNHPASGATSCTWPTQNCADFDPWGNETCNQGQACEPGGNDYRLPNAGGSYGSRVTNFQGGTLVAIAGHVHPGGKTVQVDLERDNVGTTRIFTSEAVYWTHDTAHAPGGPATSWDMSMTGATLPQWGVNVLPRDRFVITTTYDNADQSTYENMGILVAWIAPNVATGKNPFTEAVPTTGEVTHGHLAEAEVYGGANVIGLPTNLGPRIPSTGVGISGFQYFPGGKTTIEETGVPTVPLGTTTTLRFTNLDASADVYHSVTSCAYPCTGTPGIAYPISNGLSSTGHSIDFDSGQLGYGVPEIGPAKNTATWTLPITSANGFSTGIYTYFCRVHPFMRGAFAVTPS